MTTLAGQVLSILEDGARMGLGPAAGVLASDLGRNLRACAETGQDAPAEVYAPCAVVASFVQHEKTRRIAAELEANRTGALIGDPECIAWLARHGAEARAMAAEVEGGLS